jgi:hypothetical protein
MLDLGPKQVCNEINFVQLIDINEKECVVGIQSSKQQLEIFGIVAEALKEDTPLIGVLDVGPAQISSVPKVTLPIRKVVHTCPPTS